MKNLEDNFKETNNSIDYENSKNEHLIKFLVKENHNLKKLMKDKIASNETLSALLTVLELQRKRIDNIEEGIFIISL